MILDLAASITVQVRATSMALACRRLASAALSAVRSEALAAVPRLGFSALAEPTAQTLRSDENYAAVMYG